MGLRVAVANGNWSNPSTWYGGVLPAAGDIVASNGFTVTIDQNVNVDSITNTVQNPISAVPIMTDYTVPSGIASASQEYSSAYPAWKAFDGSVASGSNYWLTSNSAFIPPQWVQYEFSTSKVIRAYSVQGNFGAYPTGWQFQAWNGSAWITLDTVTGGGSLATPVVRTFANENAYTRYRFNMTAASNYSNYVSVGELKMFELIADSQSAVAGGTFNLNSGVTVTCTGTSGITAGGNTCLTYSGTGTSTINANINPLTVNAASLTFTLVHNGIGTLNINGNINASSTNGNRCCLDFSGSGVLNIVGNISGGFGNNPNARANGAGTLTIVGNISAGSNVTSLDLSNTVNTTITGNLIGGSNTGRPIYITGSAVLNITGNLTASQGGWAISVTGGTPQIFVTGSVGSVTQGNTSDVAFNVAGGSPYIKIIGTIYGGDKIYNFYSVSSTAINILTGPFISNPTGIQPIYVSRMHYLRTMGSYFEFRDNSTNGALPPATSAPATRLVSPDTVVDAPSPANVRFGTIYASGTQTGTMRVPTAASVAKDLGVDNTVGTAVLTAADVWNHLTTNMNVSGSIGERLKNCSTVATMGQQLASL